MKTYFALFIESFFLAFVLTPIAIHLFERLGLVDSPDGIRKTHSRPVPRLGGLVLVVSIAITLSSLWMVPNELGAFLQVSFATIAKFLVPALLVLLVGVVDDIRPLRPVFKLGVQVVAASVVWFQGISISLPWVDRMAPDWLSGFGSYAITVAWIIVITNAINLIDGLDGLAAGVAFLASIVMLASAIVLDNSPVIILMLPICGALLGFLRYNFAPARIFLGDCGSTFLGFVLAAIAVVYTQKKATLIAITLPFVALGLPIADTILSVLRRLIRGHSIFKSDSGHVHHKLLELGLSPSRAVMVLYGVSSVFALLALVSMFAAGVTSAIVITLFCIMVIAGVRWLPYTEFQEAGAGLWSVLSLSAQRVRNQIAFQDLCEELHSAATLEEIHSALERIARLFAFEGYYLNLVDPHPSQPRPGDGYGLPHPPNFWNETPRPERRWVLTIPLGSMAGDGGGMNTLSLYREFGKARENFPINLLVESLVPKLQQSLERVRTTTPHTASLAATGRRPTAAPQLTD